MGTYPLQLLFHRESKMQTPQAAAIAYQQGYAAVAGSAVRVGAVDHINQINEACVLGHNH